MARTRTNGFSIGELARRTEVPVVAAAIRAALRSEPTEHDVRRLVAVTRLSNEERRAVIEGFYEKVSEGSRMDAAWKKTMVDASAPTLPDDPSPEQLDAWIELAEIVQDEGFLASMREGVKQTWTADFDLAAYTRCADAMIAEVRSALGRGVGPEDDEAKRIVDDYLVEVAPLMNAAPDEAFRRSLRERFTRQDPRATRYWELVGILRGTTPEHRQAQWPHAEWEFFVAASKFHYP